MTVIRYVIDDSRYLEHFIVQFEQLTQRFFIAKIFLCHVISEHNRMRLHQGGFRIALGKRQSEYAEKIGIHGNKIVFFKSPSFIADFYLTIGI